MAGTEVENVLWDYYSDVPWFKTVDWVPVTSIDLGTGYEWEEFHAWYSPQSRLYYYGSGSGCSCNSFSDYHRQISDFCTTPRKEELRAAAIAFVDGSYRSAREVFDARNQGVIDINSFSPRQKGAE